MKINKEKINQFFEGDKFDQDIKDFVLCLMECVFRSSDNIVSAKLIFLNLGFYDLEETDDIGDDEKIINFYELSKLAPDLKKLVLKLLTSLIKDDGKTGDFFDDFMDELKIFVYYEDWKKINRKNKLDVLNKIN